VGKPGPPNGWRPWRPTRPGPPVGRRAPGSSRLRAGTHCVEGLKQVNGIRRCSISILQIDWYSAPSTSSAQRTVTTSSGSPAWRGVFSAGQVNRVPSFFRPVIATGRRLWRRCNRWPNATSPTGGSPLVLTGSVRSHAEPDVSVPEWRMPAAAIVQLSTATAGGCP